LRISSKIKQIHDEIFDFDEQKAIHEILIALSIKGKKRKIGKLIVRIMVPSRPKRPLYYVNYELNFLPKSSRFVVEQSGSYLDFLVKELRYEIEGVYSKKPLGENIIYLKKSTKELSSLLDKLMLFNNLAYVPSKHEYGPPFEQCHFFSSYEAVIIILAAVKLGEVLKEKSKYVRNFCEDLVLPGQGKIIGNWPREDTDGAPFDFKKRLLEVIGYLDFS
jgi:hypothetical protein